jgi:hypothetical protein
MAALAKSVVGFRCRLGHRILAPRIFSARGVRARLCVSFAPPPVAKRPFCDSAFDELHALTNEEQERLGLKSYQVRLLAMDQGEVKKLKVADIQRWAQAVLIAGGLEGSIDDENRGVGKVLKILRDNDVTGASLVKLTFEELLAAGIALGPAKVLAEHIAGLQALQRRCSNL